MAESKTEKEKIHTAVSQQHKTEQLYHKTTSSVPDADVPSSQTAAPSFFTLPATRLLHYLRTIRGTDFTIAGLCLPTDQQEGGGVEGGGTAAALTLAALPKRERGMEEALPKEEGPKKKKMSTCVQVMHVSRFPPLRLSLTHPPLTDQATFERHCLWHPRWQQVRRRRKKKNKRRRCKTSVVEAATWTRTAGATDPPSAARQQLQTVQGVYTEDVCYTFEKRGGTSSVAPKKSCVEELKQEEANPSDTLMKLYRSLDVIQEDQLDAVGGCLAKRFVGGTTRPTSCGVVIEGGLVKRQLQREKLANKRSAELRAKGARRGDMRARRGRGQRAVRPSSGQNNHEPIVIDSD
eukprot:GHVS01031792.1.p1 GENE.GHVS01031792.1~~GHVS01031792.1.p1  ORF type:complete len:349 (+),score=72.45 GHVS01031792.1:131-1177(+)